MINKIDIKHLCYFFLPFFWLYPAFRSDYRLKEFILNLSFIVGVIILFSVKNKAVVFFSLAALAVSVSFYSMDYFFESVPAILLICAYKYATDEKNNTKKEKNYDISGFYLTLNNIVILVQAGYCLINAEEIPIPNLKNNLLKIIVWFYLFLIIILIKVIKEKKEKKQDHVKTMKRIYISALIGLTLSILYFFIEYGNHVFSLFRVHFLCWFIFVMCVLMKEEVTKWQR